MQLKQLLNDDGAVSPVIGVILMVAITVILAAVIGAFVLNLGGGQASAPQASYSCEAGYLVHDGGDELEQSVLSYSGSGSLNGSGPYTAGDTIAPDGSTNTPFDGTLTWENPNSDDTQILVERTC